MIHSTMAEALSVVTQAWCTVSQVKRRCSAATTKAPKVPMPAASTGVATPVKITPRTRVIRVIGATMPPSRLTFSRALSRSSGGRAGPNSGLM